MVPLQGMTTALKQGATGSATSRFALLIQMPVF